MLPPSAQDRFIEVGYGHASGEDSFDVGARVAKNALTSIRKFDVSMVVVFASVHYELDRLLAGISEQVGEAPMIGASTAGELCDDFSTKGVVVAVLASPYLKVHCGLGGEVSKNYQSAVAEAVRTESVEPFFRSDNRSFWRNLRRSGNSAFGLLFSPGNTRKANSHAYGILDTLRRLSGGQLPICGGCSADDWCMDANYVFYNGKVYPDSMLISVVETQLQWGIGMRHGFHATSKRATVTKANRHEILELDGKKATAVFASLFGKSVQDLQGKHLTLTLGQPVGFATPFGTYNINVASFFTDEGGIRFAQPVFENTVLTVMDSSPEALVSSGGGAARQALVSGNVEDAALAMVFTCALRHRILGELIGEELRVVRKATIDAPVVGFLSFGEQGINEDGENRHGNEMVCVLVLGRNLTPAAEIFLENQQLLEEQKQTLVRIRQSEETFKAIVEHVPVMIDSFNEKGECTIWNREAQRQLGYGITELNGANRALELFYDAEEAEEVLKNIVRKDGKFRTFFPLARSGEKRCQEWADFSLPDGRSVSIGIDLTEQKRLEDQVLRAQKMEAISTLAGGIAHDFNNLLGVILGNVSYLQDCLDEDDENVDVLADIHNGARQAQHLTQQLLTFAKGGAPIMTVLKIEQLVREAAAFVLRGANSTFELDFADELRPVKADKGHLNQVFNNIFINAVQSMPDGGVIVARGRNTEIGSGSNLPASPGQYVKVTIEDEGTGIPKEHLQHIFEPYFTTRPTGNGLGLATAYSIIKRHGGLITVDTERDRGTAFHIYLPALTDKHNDAAPKEERTHQGKGRILIMDDQESVSRMLGRLLKPLGYESETAKDGAQAVEIYQKAYQSQVPFDLVILDLTVPGGMGGATAIQKLQKIDPTIKAVVSSGYSNDPVMANFKEYGFCGVIPKPYSGRQLTALLHRVFCEDE